MTGNLKNLITLFMKSRRIQGGYKMDNIEVAALSDVGGRSNNEDKVLTLRIGDTQVLAVADGMGGHAAGEVASNVAVTEIEKFIRSDIGNGDIHNLLKQTIDMANRQIYLLSRQNDEYADMGTTIVIALIQNDKALIANVGDSRAYQISGNRIVQITKDHSAVQELLDKGVISEEEARDHPNRHVITKVLGIQPEIEADYFNVILKQGDTLLLCSDGLTEALEDEEIRNVVNSSGDADKACAELVKQAKAKDAHDNISVIVVGER